MNFIILLFKALFCILSCLLPIIILNRMEKPKNEKKIN